MPRFDRTRLALQLLLTAVIFLCGTGRSLAKATPRDLSPIEQLSIDADSRSKPFLVFSTEMMQAITGRAEYKEEDGRKRSSIEMILELGLHGHAWIDRPLIYIDYKPLKEQIGLDASRKLFSPKELDENHELKTAIEQVRALRTADPGAKLDRTQTEINAIIERATLVTNIMNGSAFRIFPAPGVDDWIPAAVVTQAYPNEKGQKADAAWQALGQAFLNGDDAAFRTAAESLKEAARALDPEAYPTESILSLETTFAKVHPFRWAWVAYALAAIVLGVTSLRGRRQGYNIAWALVIAGFALQIYGFTARVIIAERAPVTNMYETVVWMAFATVLFAIILEAIYKSRYVFLAATPVAAVALILADTATTILTAPIKPLEAVLMNNFWLVTHVTTIVLSYGAFALALGVGHIVLVKTLLRQEVSSGLYNYLYRCLQIGVLLLAVGVILGGVWANVSWGRFWDWDPKETWALIALLGYLALLHGRIAGWWKGFGMAVGSILAFQSVIMAWYGVNFVLGEGLHSYGFGTGGFPAMMTFVAIEVAFVIFATLRRDRPSVPAREGKPVA